MNHRSKREFQDAVKVLSIDDDQLVAVSNRGNVISYCVGGSGRWRKLWTMQLFGSLPCAVLFAANDVVFWMETDQ